MNRYLILWLGPLNVERESHIPAPSVQQAVDKLRRDGGGTVKSITHVFLVIDLKGQWV